MIMKRFVVLLMVLGPLFARAQENAFEQEPVEETFRSIYQVNGQSTETIWQGFLFFAITHRFTAPVSTGVEEFWGMDGYANIRLGLAYGLNDNMMLGVGRSRLNKIYDGYFKYRFLRQQPGKNPLSLTLLAQGGIRTDDFPAEQEAFINFEDRLGYSAQLLLARKVNSWLSCQISPTYSHQNLSLLPEQPNGRFSLGMAAHTKVNAKCSIQLEYFLNQFTQDPEAQNVVGISLDYSSVKHSFQLQFTNATAILPAEFLAYTNRYFFEAEGIFFGFHITRRFDL